MHELICLLIVIQSLYCQIQRCNNKDSRTRGRRQLGSSTTVAKQAATAADDPVVQDNVAHPAPLSSGVPYSSLTVGVVRETFENERRVAITPQNAALLLKKGFGRILVEPGAGIEAQFPDEAYEAVGVTLTKREEVWSDSDILLKVRAPSLEGELDIVRPGGTLISFLYPANNFDTVAKLAKRGVTSFAMDMIPRISRAQSFDALR